MDDRKRMAEMLGIGILIGASFILILATLFDSGHPSARPWGMVSGILMQIAGWITAIRMLRKSTP